MQGARSASMQGAQLYSLAISSGQQVTQAMALRSQASAAFRQATQAAVAKGLALLGLNGRRVPATGNAHCCPGFWKLGMVFHP